jgi:hypothetical protein
MVNPLPAHGTGGGLENVLACTRDAQHTMTAGKRNGITGFVATRNTSLLAIDGIKGFALDGKPNPVEDFACGHLMIHLPCLERFMGQQGRMRIHGFVHLWETQARVSLAYARKYTFHIQLTHYAFPPVTVHYTVPYQGRYPPTMAPTKRTPGSHGLQNLSCKSIPSTGIDPIVQGQCRRRRHVIRILYQQFKQGRKPIPHGARGLKKKQCNPRRKRIE